MKKILIGILILILLIAAAFVIAGLTIPSEKSHTQVTEIDASSETVWKVLTDRDKYLEWQDQLTKVEIVDENNWIEHPKTTDPLKLKITGREEGRTLEISYSQESGFRGYWQGTLSPRGENKTLVRTTDRIVTDNWLMKVMMAMFFDIEEFAKDWNSKLKKRCEELERQADRPQLKTKDNG